jgi:N-acetylneuraminic acid mutarotase
VTISRGTQRPGSRSAILVGLVVVVLLTAGGSVWTNASEQPADRGWQTLAPVPARGTGVEGPFVAAVNSGKIIAAYGYDGGDTRRTRIYDVSTDSWTVGTRAPGPRRSEGTAVSRQNFVYALGGRARRVRADVERYDAVHDRWRSLADMPTARAGLASAIIDRDIYAIGGRRNGGGPCSGRELRVVERYDIRTNSWVTLAPLPAPRSDGAAVAVGGRVHLFGGCRVNPKTGQIRVLRSVDVYDPETNTWSREPRDLPRPRAAFYQVAVLDGGGPSPKVYIIGGWAGRGMGAASVFIYDVSADTYTRGTRMPTPRAEMGVAALRKHIYAVGGAQPAFGASVAANEVFRP